MEATLDALIDHGLGVVDLYFKVAFHVDDLMPCIPYYMALCGLVGRWLDVVVHDVPLDLQSVYEQSQVLPGNAFLEERLEWAQVGGADPGTMPHVPFGPDAALDPAHLSVVEHASRLRFVPPVRTRHAMIALARITGIRDRKRHRRAPFLSTGLEPAPTMKDDPLQGLDLQRIRFQAADRRKELHAGIPQDQVSAREDMTPFRALAAACGLPVDSVLTRLGTAPAIFGPDVPPGADEGFPQDAEAAPQAGHLTPPAGGAFWRCPRSGNHRHGDRHPSLLVRDQQIRCIRCDNRPISVVRLTSETFAVTPDEAAAFLLDLDCVIRHPQEGLRRADLALPSPAAGTLVTAHVGTSRPEGYECVIHDAGIGHPRPAFLLRPETGGAAREAGQPLDLAEGEVVTALVVDRERSLLSLTSPDLVVRALAGFVPEIVAGQVVVTDVARVPGQLCKIVVAPTQPGMDARTACIGLGADRIRAVSRLVNRRRHTDVRERLEIIPYASDREVLLKNALGRPRAVNVLIRERCAVLAVPRHQIGGAVGRGGLNSQLAGQLTGFYTEVVPRGTDLESALVALIEERRNARRAH
ncbi:hypothetical protein ACIBH1_31455 [Nonomuraea sp. NPDC050663]|uniref:hypothetical protein n=1 Tax=Nonomuraea sp. NPDC050663 TaxID=3364370 RepID=UPI0037B46CC1